MAGDYDISMQPAFRLVDTRRRNELAARLEYRFCGLALTALSTNCLVTNMTTRFADPFDALLSLQRRRVTR